MKFELGEWYLFSITGLAYIPDKGEYYILLHEDGRKMLLKTDYYVKYNFNIGQNIQCRVDKVNCTGQVFLEPKHPHYIEGQSYSFVILGSVLNEDDTISLIVRDIYENQIQVVVNDENKEQHNSTINLKVERIKKGTPILSYSSSANFLNNSNVSDNIALKITAIVNYNSEEYYSLADGERIVSRLKVKHYKHYGLNVGKSITCIWRGYDSTGLIRVEPENPWYKIGESYKFVVKGFEDYIDLSGESVRVAIVLDVMGNKCAVKIEDAYYKQIINLQEIICKVVGFRKGRPQLEIDLINF